MPKRVVAWTTFNRTMKMMRGAGDVRAVVRVLHKLNALTKCQAETAERRIDRQWPSRIAKREAQRTVTESAWEPCAAGEGGK